MNDGLNSLTHYAVYSILYTVYSKQKIICSIPYAKAYTLKAIRSTLYSIPYTLYAKSYTLYAKGYMLKAIRYTLKAIHSF